MKTAPAEAISIADVAARLGWSQRETRERLWKEHRARGRTLLYRMTSAPRAKLWADVAQLAHVFPVAFGDGESPVVRPDAELLVALHALRTASDTVIRLLAARGDVQPSRGPRPLVPGAQGGPDGDPRGEASS